MGLLISAVVCMAPFFVHDVNTMSQAIFGSLGSACGSFCLSMVRALWKRGLGVGYEATLPARRRVRAKGQRHVDVLAGVGVGAVVSSDAALGLVLW